MRCDVIISIYKAGRYFSSMLEEIPKQTAFEQCDFYFLDAASPDGEKDLYIPFCEQYPNCRFVRLDNREPLYKTWNIGIKMGESKLISNWNTDDRRSYNSLELQIADFERNEGVDVNYGIIRISRSFKPYFSLSNTRNNAFVKFSKNAWRHCAPSCLPMWRRSLHDRVGYFDESYESAGDYEFWCRCLDNGVNFSNLNFISGVYYASPTSISLRPGGKGAEETRKIVEKYVAKFSD